MRHLIWYIRSMFCIHDWENEEVPFTKRYEGVVTARNISVSATCKRCGWHRRYLKY